jgi:hypothetical protein
VGVAEVELVPGTAESLAAETTVLPSLTGLEDIRDHFPSVETLGYSLSP